MKNKRKQIARDLDAIHASGQPLLAEESDDSDHRAALLIIRSAMVFGCNHTGGFSPRECYQSVIDVIRSGELPISNKDVHIRYFEFFRYIY